MKHCIKCHIEKSIDEYYAHPRMLDGHLNKCKNCCKMDSAIRMKLLSNDAEFVTKERKRGRIKYRKLYAGTGKANPKAVKNYINKFPEKRLAVNASANIQAPFEGLERHHWSYNEQHFKDVLWLTKQAHLKAHRFIVYDSKLKMYRRFDTNELLDSKNNHFQFIVHCVKTLED